MISLFLRAGTTAAKYLPSLLASAAVEWLWPASEPVEADDKRAERVARSQPEPATTMKVPAVADMQKPAQTASDAAVPQDDDAQGVDPSSCVVFDEEKRIATVKLTPEGKAMIEIADLLPGLSPEQAAGYTMSRFGGHIGTAPDIDIKGQLVAADGKQGRALQLNAGDTVRETVDLPYALVNPQGEVQEGIIRIVPRQGDELPADQPVYEALPVPEALVMPHEHRFKASEDTETVFNLDTFLMQGNHVGGRFDRIASKQGLKSAAIDGKYIRFTGEKDYVGPARITVEFEDDHGEIFFEDIDIDITPVNDAPTAQKLPDLIVKPGQRFYTDVRSYFTDVDNKTLTYSVDTFMASRHIKEFIAVVPERAEISGIMPAGYRATVTVRARDAEGLEVSQSFTLGASADRSPLSAGTDTIHIADRTSSVFISRSRLLENDIHKHDTDTSRVSLRMDDIPWAEPANGTLSQNEDGDFIYVPGAGFKGADKFKYLVGDCTHEGKCSNPAECGHFDVATVWLIQAG